MPEEELPFGGGGVEALWPELRLEGGLLPEELPFEEPLPEEPLPEESPPEEPLPEEPPSEESLLEEPPPEESYVVGGGSLPEL